MKMNYTWAGAGLAAGCLLLAQIGMAEGVEQNLEKTFPVQPGGKLVLQADHGAVEVTTGATDHVRVRVLREAKNATKKQAEELFANHEVTFSQDGNKVSVTARNKKSKILSWGRQPWLRVRYEISIPSKFDVDLRTAGGDIQVGALDGNAAAQTASGSISLPEVTGRVDAKDAGGNVSIGEASGAVNAQTTSGSITIKKAKGNAVLEDAGGNIRLEEAGGDVAARTASGSISLGNVQGAVKATDAGGDIRMDSVEGEVQAQTVSGAVNIGRVNGRSVRVKNAGGNITLGDVAGDVWAETVSGSIQVQSARGKIEAKDAGGDISIGDAGQVTAETQSGSISVKRANGQLEAKDAGGNIAVGEVRGDVSVRTTSGAIEIGKITGKLSAHDAGGNITVAEAHSVVSAETSSGSIDVNFARAPGGECHLSVAGGGIKAMLPASAMVDLDARALGGSVSSDLPVTMTVGGGEHSGTLMGKINGGGPALVLRASSGNIHVKASAATPMAAEDETPGK